MESDKPFIWKKIQDMGNIDRDNEDFQKCVEDCRCTECMIIYSEVVYENNSYFLAVMLRYMHLIHGDCYTGYLEKFYNLLIEIRKYLVESGMPSFVNPIDDLICFLSTSIESQRKDERKQFVNLISNQNNLGFQKILIECGRLITYYTIINDRDFDRKYFFMLEVKEIILESLLDIGKEPESIIFDYLPIGLDCDVYQYNLFTTIGIQKFPIENPERIKDTLVEVSEICQIYETPQKIHINLLRRGYQYYLLSTIQEMENEQWCISEDRYHYYEARG